MDKQKEETEKKKFWFRICFERECDTKEDADEFLEELTDNIWESDTMSKLNCEIEEA